MKPLTPERVETLREALSRMKGLLRQQREEVNKLMSYAQQEQERNRTVGYAIQLMRGYLHKAAQAEDAEHAQELMELYAQVFRQSRTEALDKLPREEQRRLGNRWMLLVQGMRREGCL